MKTAISIATPIFREAEKAARRLGLSRSEFFTRAAQRMVESIREDEVKASYDAAFATDKAPAETAFRRKASRRLLAAIEWDDE
jgi:hypothetical protein